jgi:hypothetical protein
MTLEELSLRCHGILRRSPEFFADVTEEDLHVAELREADRARWISYWRRNPIAAWTSAKKDRRTWFRLEEDLFVIDLEVKQELVFTLTQMTRELVDYRLAQYLARRRQTGPSSEGFVCKVISNQRDPILKLRRALARRSQRGKKTSGFPTGRSGSSGSSRSSATLPTRPEWCAISSPTCSVAGSGPAPGNPVPPSKSGSTRRRMACGSNLRGRETTADCENEWSRTPFICARPNSCRQAHWFRVCI